MQVKARAVSPALKALMESLFDYAGLYPPAALALDDALASYDRYRHGDYAWMLRWFVVGQAELERVPPVFDGCLSVLAAADQLRASAVESKVPLSPAGRPVYCEVPLDRLAMLDEIRAAGNFAKIRTGGLTAEAIPPAADVAAFIISCAERRLPFKATAGLHHPLRGDYPLTYAADSERAEMHGFLNVLMAAALAWHGDRDIEPVLLERDPAAFSFDDRAGWRGRFLDAARIREARRDFMHAIGSCSFAEPVDELQAMGLLG